MHPTLWDFTRSPCAQPQARPTLQISFLTALHRRIIWSSSQLSVRRRPSLRSISVSDRNHTPLSGALSQVCVLENVSRSCNHQHRSRQIRKPGSRSGQLCSRSEQFRQRSGQLIEQPSFVEILILFSVGKFSSLGARPCKLGVILMKS
jgi:hypothetical protein